MSGGNPAMAMDEMDVSRFLAAYTHIGSTIATSQMKQYVFKRRPDGVHIINLGKTHEKLLLAARAIAAIENPADVFCISSRPMGQRAVLKFSSFTGATPIAGRFTPGAFTNQIQAAFREPRLLVVTDPRQDHQPVNEASYVNVPVIAFCNTDTPLRHVDIAIPCNNKNYHSIGLMWWMLAREVLRLRGSILRTKSWEVDTMPDLFFFRRPEDTKKAAKEEAAKAEMPLEQMIEEPMGDLGMTSLAIEGGAATIPGLGDPITGAVGEAVIPSVVADAAAGVTASPKADWAEEGQVIGATQDWGGEDSWAKTD